MDRQRRSSPQEPADGGDAEGGSRRALAATRWSPRSAACVVALMVGASYAAVPFYNWFCRATGFNGTTQVADAGADGGAARAQDRGALRLQRRAGPALEVRAGTDRDRGPDRRGRHRLLHRDQPVGADHHGAGGLQRRAADGRIVFPEDQLLLLHRADHGARREARDAGGVLCRSGDRRRQRERRR